jgi:hypothetical protein
MNMKILIFLAIKAREILSTPSRHPPPPLELCGALVSLVLLHTLFVPALFYMKSGSMVLSTCFFNNSAKELSNVL